MKTENKTVRCEDRMFESFFYIVSFYVNHGKKTGILDTVNHNGNYRAFSQLNKPEIHATHFFLILLSHRHPHHHTQHNIEGGSPHRSVCAPFLFNSPAKMLFSPRVHGLFIYASFTQFCLRRLSISDYGKTTSIRYVCVGEGPSEKSLLYYVKLLFMGMFFLWIFSNNLVLCYLFVKKLRKVIGLYDMDLYNQIFFLCMFRSPRFLLVRSRTRVCSCRGV